MTCEAALRSGAGIVTLVCPWELNSIMEIKLTEVMTYPVEQTDDITIHMDAFEDIQLSSEKFDALAIGPGISKNPSTIRLVREILKKIKKPTVLDADGLRALYGPREIGEDENLDFSHVVITPHPGELSAILGVDGINQEDRLKSNFEVVKKYRLVSVLKGAATLISNPENMTFINPTGSWALATAGTGDILTGIIGSLLSQGMGLTDAAVCGTFIHGLASDIIAKNTSRTSQIATDLLEGIKNVFMDIEKIKY
jgi:NAD(P)H-hydrate epimerase